MVSPDVGIGILLGAGTTVALGFTKKTGGLLAEDTYQRFRRKILNRKDTEENESVLDTVEKIREEKKKVHERLEEAQSTISDYDRITRSLKSQNISRDKLVEHYWEPLHGVILCFTNQKDSEGRTLHFLKRELSSRYGLKQLTGDIYIIPPNQVPEKLRDGRTAREDIKKLIKDEVYKNYPNAKSTICFAARVDMRDVYSRTDHPTEDRINMFRTVDEVLDLDEIFTKGNFSKALASENVNLSEVIEEGSLPFLASDYLTDSELDDLIENEGEIKKQLDNPSLKHLAKNMNVNKLANELNAYVIDEKTVANSIIEEAKIWYQAIYKNSNDY